MSEERQEKMATDNLCCYGDGSCNRQQTNSSFYCSEHERPTAKAEPNPVPPDPKCDDLFRLQDGRIYCNKCNFSNEIKYGSAHYTDCVLFTPVAAPPAPSVSAAIWVDDIERTLSSGFGSSLTITAADSAEGERIVKGWPEDKVREYAANWVARAEARQRFMDSAIARIRKTAAVPAPIAAPSVNEEMREALQRLIQGIPLKFLSDAVHDAKAVLAKADQAPPPEEE